MSREVFKRAAKQKKRREESEAKAARPAPRATLVKKASSQKAPRAIPVEKPKDPRSRVNTTDELSAVKEAEKADKKKKAADQKKYKASKNKAAMLREYGPAGKKRYEGK